MANMRVDRLKRHFYDIVGAKKTVTSKDPKLFLEALCKQAPAVSAVSRLVASSRGMEALLTAVSSDTSVEFLNGLLSVFLEYIRTPELQTLCGGDVVKQVIAKIMEAPLMWESLVKSARSQILNQQALSSFAWLLLHLLSLPVEEAVLYLSVAQDEAVQKALLDSSLHATRLQGQRIIRVARTLEGTALIPAKSPIKYCGPGGRHDNDFADIRKISIYPTADELKTKDPYLPRACDVEEQSQGPDALATHIDSQFRLLRDDMLRDLRDELLISKPATKRFRRKLLQISNLRLINVGCNGRSPWSLLFCCENDLPQLRGKTPYQRKKLLKDNPKFLKHGFLACLMINNEFITLGTLVRDENLLIKSPTILCIEPPATNIEKVLLHLKDGGANIHLLQVDTAIFTYEPVLKKLRETRELLLEPELIAWKAGTEVPPPEYGFSFHLHELLEVLEFDPSANLEPYLRLQNETRLDKAQAECFCAALKQRVAVIQGPPGTGKSFIGSLLGKAIYENSQEKILVVCYTHHALNDFVEELLNLGIPNHDIVRLGSTVKASPRTQSLGIKEYNKCTNLSQTHWKMLDVKKHVLNDIQNRHCMAFNDFFQFQPSVPDLLEFLEFWDDNLPFFSAFLVPEEKDGMSRVGRRGETINKFYLLKRWLDNQDAGIYRSQMNRDYSVVWNLTPEIREQKCQQWYFEMIKERVARVRETGKLYNSAVKQRDSIFMEKDLAVMREKRIIACTTTAAAKYSKILDCISPGVLLVEEAGEILESHVLTSLNPTTKHLILIGDHKQLRPKVNYELSVEKGMGYDLNRSLFERLVLKKFPHQTLFSQHRMRPEISDLVRQMTYPELKDAEDTEGRPDLRGFTDNIIFVNHDERETELKGACELGDSKATSSKQNQFEVKMTLKCVRYLGQQGYRTDNIVVLTPYLGQLKLLFDELKVDNDPVLNDLDSHDLVRAGLMPDATAQVDKPRLRISTIDNFQGEEADIVVASLTRSNDDGEIGWMSAPERLNVLISRARNALILIGNAEHFMSSRKGSDLWKQFIGLLKVGKHVYDGFPVRCERHHKRTAILKKPSDFDTECPDGGCKEPCGKMLNCGLHKCPDHCHMLYDHSKMQCKTLISIKCTNDHILMRECHAKDPQVCQKCDDLLRKAQEEAERKIKAQKAQEDHNFKMAELDREIQKIRDEAAWTEAAKQRAHALEQKKKDLVTAKNVLQKRIATNVKSETPNTPAAKVNVAGPTPDPRTNPASQQLTESEPEPLSKAEADWERQKQIDGAANDAIDALMSLTGLEAVKLKVLDIKMKIEVAALQGTDVSKERFGVTMLGNPGTGKTTVARIYGQFLASVDAIPGSEFVEVSGSSLANDGVSGAQKKIEELVKAGGGVFFLDEAYQLASGNSYGGKAVLDFLLAEIEERRGTIVFILAGYKKEMEAFFEHNPGFSSRVPHNLNFADYSDAELLKMLGCMLQKKYNSQAKLVDGTTGLFARILIRRQGRRRGTRDYGNARDLENTWAQVTERQASRLRIERRTGTPDPYLFTQTDLIGPEPSHAVQNSDAWLKLQKMTGLKSVKESVATLIERIAVNYLRELDEMEPLEVSLNRLFLGSPGTGKTTVAKLYGEILAEIGLLSKAEVVMKTPADFIGSVLGESEKNTKAILQAAKGKVLLIDEAYGLSPTGNTAGKGGGDIYRTAVIDTIVAEVQSTPGEDRCVLLLGYTEQMQEMLRNANPGLSRRFPLDSAFHFEDFDDEALKEILVNKLKAQHLEATGEAIDVAIGLLSRARDRPNFGNAGEVENLLSRAKDTWQKRQIRNSAQTELTSQVIFAPEDFDENYDRAQTSECSVKDLFSDIVGLDELKEKLEKYRKQTINLKARNLDPRNYIPFSYVFKGPPGTGKTTVARRIAKFYYSINILSTEEYTDCSAADLVGAYVGQTAPKTKETLRSALGKVLFIDEAYRLKDGEFGKEAINEIVDCMTKPDFMGKLVVILAGYTDDMNDLLRVNPGLASRFSEEVFFESMQPEQCIELLTCKLLKPDLKSEVKLFLKLTEDLRTPGSKGYLQMSELFTKLKELPSWGNGRDICTLAKKIVGTAFENANPSVETVRVETKNILHALNSMLAEQMARSHATQPSIDLSLNKAHKVLAAKPPPCADHAPKINITSSTAPKACLPKIKSPEAEQVQNSAVAKILSDGRDPGVSDQIWQQLQLDMIAQKKLEERAKAELERQETMLMQAERQLLKQKHKLQRQENEVLQMQGESDTRNQNQVRRSERIQRLWGLLSGTNAEKESLRQQESERERNRANQLQQELELARIRAVELQRARDAEELRLQMLRKAQEEERRREQQVQKKLRNLGMCVAGYRWIKQSDGYRCAGGSHFVGNAELGL